MRLSHYYSTLQHTDPPEQIYTRVHTEDELKIIYDKSLWQSFRNILSVQGVTNLNDLHMGTESGWKTKVQDPVESGTQQHYNISLQ